MRARNLRPSFDSLDIRLVLSDSSAALVGVGLAGVAVTVGNPSQPQGLACAIDWYLPGTPPLEEGDPTLMALPWDAITTE